MQYTVHAAKTQLSRLIEAALAGEEVIIAKGSTPVVRLVALQPSAFRLGILDGQVGKPPDFLEPMRADELEAWEGR